MWRRVRVRVLMDAEAVINNERVRNRHRNREYITQVAKKTHDFMEKLLCIYYYTC